MLALSTALAPGLVARVADRPITQVEYDHWMQVKLRVRLDLPSEKLREHAVGNAKTPEGQQRRLTRYVRQFHARSRRMTACGTGDYVKQDCGKEVPLSA